MMKIWLAIVAFICTNYLPVAAQNAASGGQRGSASGQSAANSSSSSRSPVSSSSSTSSGSSPYVQTFGAATQGYGSANSRYAPANQRDRAAYPGSAAANSTFAPRSRATTSSANTSRGAVTASGKAFDFTDAVNSGGLKRTFIVHVPANYNRTKPMPVIFAFHGLGMSGSMMMYLTNFNHAADKQGFIAVYPNANGGKWEDGRGTGVDDVQFVTDMIAKLSTEINIDQRKVYAAGLSNGGHFVQFLAGQSNRIAAIAVVSSSIMAGAANSAGGHRMPVILFIGTDDPLVPSADSSHNATLGKLGDAVGLSGLGSLSEPIAKLGGMLTAEETVEFWCKNNGCSAAPYTVQMPDKDANDGTKVTRYSYGTGGNEVVYYSIRGGGHSWPGSLVSIGARDILGKTSLDINATDLIVDFFFHH